MSADTSVVIAGLLRHPSDKYLTFTAAVVQAAEDLVNEGSFSLKKAQAIFMQSERTWFTGHGGLSRAKQFANLLAEDLRESGVLDHEDRTIIEICAEGPVLGARTRYLSWTGKPLPEYFGSRLVTVTEPARRPFA